MREPHAGPANVANIKYKVKKQISKFTCRREEKYGIIAIGSNMNAWRNTEMTIIFFLLPIRSVTSAALSSVSDGNSWEKELNKPIWKLLAPNATANGLM